ASTYAFARTEAWFPLYQNLPDGSPTVAVNDTLAAGFGGAFQLVVETDADWERLRAVEAAMVAAGSGPVLSEVAIARWLGTQARPDAGRLTEIAGSGVDRLRATDGGARLFAQIDEPMRSDAALARYEAIRDAALANGARSVIGLPAVMREESVALIGQLSRSIVIAALGATLLVALAFRSLRLVPVLLLPNILPLMLTGAALQVFAGGKLIPTAVLALTIAFGVAIDDTVHFLSRHAQARARGMGPTAALSHAVAAAGEVMVLTTALLGASLCITYLSDFATVRLFGTMMITTLVAAVLVDLTLLPALLTPRDTADDPS
ncbi:MAG: MMPL family transporter, partial [Jannaschia sp.]